MLYKTRSEAVLKTIMEDIADEITDEEFYDVYDKACIDKHDFLFIDWAPKQHQFRRNFDEYLPVASDPAQNGRQVSEKSRRGASDGSDKQTRKGGHPAKEGKIARRVEGQISRGIGIGVPKLR